MAACQGWGHILCGDWYKPLHGVIVVPVDDLGANKAQHAVEARWAAVEAVQVLPYDWKLRADRDRIAARRGPAVGKVAAARKLLTLVFYGLRDGHIRCLDNTTAAA